MGYRVLDFSRSPGRLSETIGVGPRGISFNSMIRGKMGFTSAHKLVFAVSDDGFLAINVCGKNDPTGIAPFVPHAYSTYYIYRKQLLRHLTPGRYHITGRDGAFLITDIKYNEV